MDLSKVRPLDNRVVVKRNEAKDTTPGGIVLPEPAKEKPRQGTVVAVGPGKLSEYGERMPLQVKVGDEVIFTGYVGPGMNQDEEEYLIMGEEDILAVV